MASVIDKDFSTDFDEEEEVKQKKQDLQDKLIRLVKQKIEKNLTARQREAIHLSFLGKKQEHMGAILGISQEAVHTRLKLGVQKLTEICNKDPEIQEAIAEIDSL
jgi:RNA polymerase sigma factor (sigma-70 family)